jgi:hypothetical protein
MTGMKRVLRAFVAAAKSVHDLPPDPDCRRAESPEKLFIKDVLGSKQWQQSDPDMRVSFSSFLAIAAAFVVLFFVTETMREHGFWNFSTILVWGLIWFNMTHPIGHRPFHRILEGEPPRPSLLLRSSAVLPVRPVVARRAVYLQPLVKAALVTAVFVVFDLFFSSTNSRMFPLKPSLLIALLSCPFLVAGLNTCLALGNFGMSFLHAIAAIGVWFVPKQFEDVLAIHNHPAWYGDIIIGVAALAFAAIVPLTYLRSDSRRPS